MIAKVVIDIAHHDINKPFDYIISESLINVLEIGMRVKVSFSSTHRLGIVVDIKKDSKIKELKTISEIDTTFPILDHTALNNIKMLVKTFAMTYQEAISLISPLAFQTVYKYVIMRLSEDNSLNKYERFFDANGKWILKKQEKKYLPELKSLQQKGIVSVEHSLKNKGLGKPVKAYQKEHQSNQKYQSLLDAMSQHETYSKKALIERGFTISKINTMLKHGLISKREVIMTQPIVNASSKRLPKNKDIWLHATLKDVLPDIKGYMRDVQERKQSMLILVPEQKMLHQLKEALDDIPFIYASHMTHVQRAKFEQHVQKTPSIIIGTKSSVFLNIYALSVVFVCHSFHDAYDMHLGNYYNPKYVIKTLYPKVQVMYQSPFPTVFVNSLKDVKTIRKTDIKYDVNVISMKQELLEGHTHMISRALKKQMDETLEKNNNIVILFQRKGYRAFHMCRMCGEVSHCKVCGQKLIVNSDSSLFCKHCGTSTQLFKTCSKGHENFMKPVGVGIDYVQKILHDMYPDKNIKKATKEHTPSGSFDIMIGTNKVIDYINGHTSLKVILMADMLWNHDHYDSYEKAFYMMMNFMTHLSSQQSKTMIQAYDTDHIILKGLHAPQTFIDGEVNRRRLALLPPYSNMYDIFIPSDKYLIAYKKALQMKEFFESHHIRVIGPRQDEDDQTFIVTIKVMTHQQHILSDWLDTHQYQIERI